MSKVVVAIIGLGTMGQGIAAAVAAAGHEVRVFDQPDRLGRCVEETMRRARRLLKEGQEARVRGVASIDAAVDAASLVIEAVPEDLAVKSEVLGEISRACPPAALLMTNTSALPLSELEKHVVAPQRFVAAHFFNPAELVPGVEVAAAPATDPAIVVAAMEFLGSIGKEPIRVGSKAGFVANRIQLALFLEALACVEDGMATPDEVDAVVRRTFGFRLPAYGPFAIADMAGLDVYASILDTLEGVYGPRFALPPALEDLVRRGRLGVKSGVGFREYTGQQIEDLLAGRDSRYRRLLAAADQA